MQWIEVPDEATLFLDACAAGMSFCAAAGCAEAAVGAVDPLTWLPLLTRAGAFTALAIDEGSP